MPPLGTMARRPGHREVMVGILNRRAIQLIVLVCTLWVTISVGGAFVRGVVENSRRQAMQAQASKKEQFLNRAVEQLGVKGTTPADKNTSAVVTSSLTEENATSLDGAEMSAAAHPAEEEYDGSLPMLVLLFITRGDMPFTPVWRKFLDGCPLESTAVVVHSQASSVEQYIWYYRQLNATILPEPDLHNPWHSYAMVDIQMRLWEAGLKQLNGRRGWLHLADELSVPLVSCWKVFDHLQRGVSAPRTASAATAGRFSFFGFHPSSPSPSAPSAKAKPGGYSFMLDSHYGDEADLSKLAALKRKRDAQTTVEEWQTTNHMLKTAQWSTLWHEHASWLVANQDDIRSRWSKLNFEHGKGLNYESVVEKGRQTKLLYAAYDELVISTELFSRGIVDVFGRTLTHVSWDVTRGGPMSHTAVGIRCLGKWAEETGQLFLRKVYRHTETLEAAMKNIESGGSCPAALDSLKPTFSDPNAMAIVNSQGPDEAPIVEGTPPGKLRPPLPSALGSGCLGTESGCGETLYDGSIRAIKIAMLCPPNVNDLPLPAYLAQTCQWHMDDCVHAVLRPPNGTEPCKRFHPR